MVKNIVKDPFFLRQKSEPATEGDAQVIEDLIDTFDANRERCVGMAANMIGVRKRIIVVAMGPFLFPMINPVITKNAMRLSFSTTNTKEEIDRFIEVFDFGLKGIRG